VDEGGSGGYRNSLFFCVGVKEPSLRKWAVLGVTLVLGILGCRGGFRGFSSYSQTKRKNNQ
jgi:hypothetical protein